MNEDLEIAACRSHPVELHGFNPQAEIPYGCSVEHIRRAMVDFVNFLGFINQQLHLQGLERLETMLMPANFSSMVGEFMVSGIPKYCSTVVKNKYHNGHPDLLPVGYSSSNAAQHAAEGIEIKGSRYLRGWQGHNPEDTWLIVFVFDSNRPGDAAKGIQPRPFRFMAAYGAQLSKDDWLYSGRSETSRRTITASVARSGYEKMQSNWIYRHSTLK